jgi:uncharacterized protein (DUF433 family)
MMPGLPDFVEEFLKTVKVVGEASVLHKPGAVRLDGYPLLAYAPSQHGPGIRTEDNGTPVADIVTELAVNPSVQAVAAKFNTTAAHVADAVRYATDTQFISIE